MKRRYIGYGNVAYTVALGALSHIMSFLGIDTSKSDVQTYELVLAFTVGLSACYMFFWMLADILKKKDLKRRGAWILCMLLFNWATSVVYFFAKYVPEDKLKNP